MIIDAHCHMGVSWLGWQRVGISMERLLEIYNTLGIDKACLNAWQIPYDTEGGNKEVYELKKKYPNQIIGFGIVCPRDRSRALDEVHRCVQDYGFKGLKLHPTINSYMVDSTLVDPIMDLAEKYSLSVLIHSQNDGYSHPRMIAALAKRHPATSVIIGHMGEDAWVEAVEMVKKHTNLYLDTTGIPNEVYIIPTAVAEVGANRIVWGSDSPVLNAAVELSRITSADLYGKITEKDKNLILGGNIARILSI